MSHEVIKICPKSHISGRPDRFIQISTTGKVINAKTGKDITHKFDVIRISYQQHLSTLYNENP